MVSRFWLRGAFGLWLIGLVIGIGVSRSLHSRLLYIVGLCIVATATLLLAAYFAIGNPLEKRGIGRVIGLWTALFGVWLMVPALHRTPFLHYGTGTAWFGVFGVLIYILWQRDRREESANQPSSRRKQIKTKSQRSRRSRGLR